MDEMRMPGVVAAQFKQLFGGDGLEDLARVARGGPDRPPAPDGDLFDDREDTDPSREGDEGDDEDEGADDEGDD